MAELDERGIHIHKAFRTEADVLKHLMDVLEDRIKAVSMVGMIVDIAKGRPEVLDSMHPQVRPLAENPEQQLKNLASIKEFLFEAVVERRAMDSVRKVGPDNG